MADTHPNFLNSQIFHQGVVSMSPKTLSIKIVFLVQVFLEKLCRVTGGSLDNRNPYTASVKHLTDFGAEN